MLSRSSSRFCAVAPTGSSYQRRSVAFATSNICPIIVPTSASARAQGKDYYELISLKKLPKSHNFFNCNSILRSAADSFFHLTPKNTKRGCVISASSPSSSSSSSSSHYDRFFTHSKLFADACLLAATIDDAVLINGRCAVRSPSVTRSDFNNRPPATSSSPECGICNVAIHLPSGYDFCVALLATWLARCRAVPLNTHATDAEIDHILTESSTRIILTSASSATDPKRKAFFEHHSRRPMQIPVVFSLKAEQSLTNAHRAAIHDAFIRETVSPLQYEDDALLIATSGTTGNPKLATSSHLAVSRSTVNLLSAWKWTHDDSLLHTLPLHHVHGLVNGVCCGIAASANIDFSPFDPAHVVKRLESGDISLFFSVPAAYKKILSFLEKHSSEQEKEEFKTKMQKNIRLFISGSSALPLPVLQEFEKISGHKMLERYGMTELGMIMSQPYEPASERIPGTVGLPLPTVQVMLKSAPTENDQEEVEGEKGVSDAKTKSEDETTTYDLLIRSEAMFSRYWGNLQKTKESFVFDKEGLAWFDTGDCVKLVYEKDDDDVGQKVGEREKIVKSYAIQGRTSVDIIKVSGYKISAVEIENALLDTGLVEECAVFALHAQQKQASSSSPNETEDGTIVALVTPSATARKKFSFSNNAEPDHLREKVIEELQSWMETNFSHYKRPRKYFWEEHGIERNAMGKINKKSLAKKYSL